MRSPDLSTAASRRRQAAGGNTRRQPSSRRADASAPHPGWRARKASRIQAILDEIYPMPPIPLVHRDPYTLLVAVILSAQCTDKRVNLVAPKLLALAPTPERMARLSAARIARIIRPCGLAPAKSKAIASLSRILMREHGGRVPRSFAALEALPGVGHKSASVVMAQAFGEPAFPVDTHIHRLAHRWGLSDGSSVRRTETNLKQVFPRSSWNKLHLQMIYFGRQYCPARAHDARQCPVCAWASPAARAGTAAKRSPAGRTARSATRRKLRVPGHRGRAKSHPGPAKSRRPA